MCIRIRIRIRSRIRKRPTQIHKHNSIQPNIPNEPIRMYIWKIHTINTVNFEIRKKNDMLLARYTNRNLLTFAFDFHFLWN